MSRSSESVVRRTRLVGLMAVVTTAVVATPARAADPPPTDAPVLTIVAPVLDIDLPTADLRGLARVEEAPKRVRVVLSSELLFAKDSADLRPGVQGRLGEIAAELRARGPGRLAIIGYTDDLGTAAHGLVLSRQRAAAVRVALAARLGADYAYTVVGRGEADPAVPNTSEANRSKNRRVVVTFTPTG